ncbi:hypothetical protein TRM7615_02860 [Falsiruegeria mediterranea M17]|uniref:Uncharacterized protein n=1 Tax=Falsiruegeria mediterranea M17 TaxID=1200281 RepID=A0A2R8CAH2_9RHOB|nr:hypothetical protein TRM7615_02860 [Falsiruegeria mediterranea M17]
MSRLICDCPKDIRMMVWGEIFPPHFKDLRGQVNVEGSTNFLIEFRIEPGW